VTRAPKNVEHARPPARLLCAEPLCLYRIALEQLLDEEREAQLERERKWRVETEGQHGAMEAARGQLEALARERAALEQEREVVQETHESERRALIKDRQELEKEQAVLQEERIRARQAMEELKKTLVEEKESLAQERVMLAEERDRAALQRKHFRKRVIGVISSQALVYARKMRKHAFFLRWLRIGLFRQQKAATEDRTLVPQNNVTPEHLTVVAADEDRTKDRDKRQHRRVARLWASARARRMDKVLLMLVSSRWMRFAVRSSQR